MTSGQILDKRGFTIVELLIVIVVIGILASITIVAFNGIQNRARTTARNSDAAHLLKAITAARIHNDTTLMGITGSSYSLGTCIGTGASQNPDGIEPKNLPKTHICWQRYYNNLTLIGAAAGMNLDGLRAGDPGGNPYMWDENEGEAADDGVYCRSDSSIVYFTGNGIARQMVQPIPKHFQPTVSPCP